MQPVGRDQHDAGADGVRRVTKDARLAADHDLAGLGPAHTGQAIEQLLLALTLEGRDPENLAEAKHEADATQHAGLQVAHLHRHRPCGGRAR